MISNQKLDGNSQHQKNVDQLLKLCVNLSDELSDLKKCLSLIYSAWTEDDNLLKPDDDWFFSSDEQLEKIRFLLGIFCNRFTAKDIRELLETVDKIRELLLETVSHSDSDKK